MARPVVVGIDGSPESLAAAQWACDEAGRRQAPVRLLHAWSVTTLMGPVTVEPDDPGKAAGLLLARTRDELSAREPEAGIDVRSVAGDPVTALLDAAAAADLIVLGSRGLGAVSGFLLGSVSSRVVARSRCPAVLIRGRRAAAEAGSEVVLGLKRPREPDERALAFAFDAAERRGLPLRVVHTWHVPLPPNPFQPLPAGAPEPGVAEASALAEVLRPWRADHPDVPVSETLLAGSAAQALVDAAADAALVVVGRGGRHGPGARVGAVTHALLHHARSPVAVVPPA
ncbi:universal stress protein [Streptomyces sp. DSM 44917]|uniref:Universal stress protein n=1 Tax=Streptomyces boetiae TaxID=3075541 RepID=A0ABU2L7N3_9ACTN|nr:universal stress protein [Streptomyces sp. DSM 44917]MDT0307512.1 universal stress protein [Streptomyces sp. DSM 44917]